MDLMKKVNAFVLGLAVLLAFGCGGDEPEPDNPTPGNPSLKTCLPVKTKTYIYGGEWNYVYNSLGQISKATRTNHTYMDELERITYNADGTVKKISRFTLSTNTFQNYSLYEYNAGSFLIKETLYDPSIPADSTSAQPAISYHYEYDTANRLIKKSLYYLSQPGVASSYFTYTYNAAGGVREEEYLRKNTGTGGMYLRRVMEFQFTNHKAPGGNLAYLNLPDNPKKYSDEILFQRLPATVTDIHYMEDGSISSQTVYNYTYVLNADGYPTEQSLTSSVSQQPLTTYWTYNCQ